MLKKDLENPRLADAPVEQAAAVRRSFADGWIALIALAFVLCFLVSVGVLSQFAATSTYIPFSSQLAYIGTKLLHKLHLQSTFDRNLAFIAITGIEFVLYGLAALLISRQTTARENQRAMLFIWLGAIVAGGFLLGTRALISRDIFVYAGYGHSLVAYGANPYFVVPDAFPKDPITLLDDWKDVTAAYGPLWLNICSLLALIAGRSATMYLLLFRLAAFAAHLVNIILVMAILRTQGRSNRIVALGMFLYAWNPLVFVESCLSGHNDIFMITFILLGVLFCARAEQQGFTRPIHYLLPASALTLAGLIKFTALPLVAFYLVLLVRKTLYAPTDDGGKSTTFAPSQLRAAIFRLLLAGIASGLTIVLFYGPFFIGHSIPAIVNSFTSPPSSHSAEHSIMQALVDWVAHHGMPAHTSVLYPLLSRLIKYKVWSYITILVVLSALVAGSISLWRAPTTRTFVLAGIAVLGALLIVTTWFYPWYVTWLVGLAAVSLPLSRQCIARALCAFALVFAVSARMTYLYLGLVYVDASAISIVATMTPPLLAFLFFLAIDKLPWERALAQSASAVSEA